MAHNSLETPQTHFCGIGLENTRNPFNIGSCVRAAGCFGGSFLTVQGSRFKEHKADWRSMDVEQARKRIPVFLGVSSLLDYVPYDTQIVAVERDDTATSLVDFRHPRRCFYIFGPEDSSVSKEILDRANHKVYIPTAGSMNLGACVYTVLYDRMSKSKEFIGNQPECPHCGNYYVKKTENPVIWTCCGCGKPFEVDMKAD